jgi:hypothetical protein
MIVGGVGSSRPGITTGAGGGPLGTLGIDADDPPGCWPWNGLGSAGAAGADTDGAASDAGATGGATGDDGTIGGAANPPPNASIAALIGLRAPTLGLAAPGSDPIGALGAAAGASVCINVCSTALSGENPPTCRRAALPGSPTSGEIDRAPRTRGIRMESTWIACCAGGSRFVSSSLAAIGANELPNGRAI